MSTKARARREDAVLISLEKELHKKLKILSIIEGKTMKEMAQEVLSAWMKTKKIPGVEWL